MDWIDRLAAYWNRQGLLHGQLPTAHEVKEFEDRCSVTLPADVREYFLPLNGTAGGQYMMADEDLIAFWRLDQVATLAAEGVTNVRDATHWFIFADHSIWGHAYAISLALDRNAAPPVAICYNPAFFQIAPSFSLFIDGYLRRDPEILYPEPPYPLLGDA